MRLKFLALAAVAALGLSSAANAMQIYFSTSNVVGLEGGPANASLTIPVGGSGTLYVWALPTTAESKINGLSLTATAGTAGIITAGSHTVLNPVNVANDPDTRWDSTGNGNLTASGWTSDNAVATSMAGIRNNSNATYAADPGHDLTNQAYLISSFSFVGAKAGVTNLFFAVGSSTVSNTAGATIPVFFGGGDTTSAAGNVAGAQSNAGAGATADATITVGAAPEPASIGMLGLGAVGLIRRRRQA